MALPPWGREGHLFPSMFIVDAVCRAFYDSEPLTRCAAGSAPTCCRGDPFFPITVLARYWLLLLLYISFVAAARCIRSQFEEPSCYRTRVLYIRRRFYSSTSSSSAEVLMSNQTIAYSKATFQGFFAFHGSHPKCSSVIVLRNRSSR